MRCSDFREIADSYLGDELLIETNHGMLRHLQSCADCRRELAARRELRAGLRAAFDHAEEWQIDNEFATRLRADLQAQIRPAVKAPMARRSVWLALAACLLVAAGFGIRAVQQSPRQPPPPQIADGRTEPSNQSGRTLPSPPASSASADEVMAAVRGVMAASAAGVHRDCAVAHRIEEMPIELAEAGRRYDRAYLELTRAVISRQQESSRQFKLVMAHSCVFGGRRYGHVVLEDNGRLISVLVTTLDQAGDSPAHPTPDLTNPDQQVMACASAAGYQVAGCTTARHALFIVSDLTEAENLAVARRLAPAIHQHLTRAESVA